MGGQTDGSVHVRTYVHTYVRTHDVVQQALYVLSVVLGLLSPFSCFFG